jgi:hypothetical protein
MIDARQLLTLIIRPTLIHIGMHSVAAEQLVLGTALVESGARHLQQVGGGPALGLWQMEPATCLDLEENYIRHRRDLDLLVEGLRTSTALTDGAFELVGNLYYGAAMCRIHYRRVPSALPYAGDISGQARYWKAHYNTALGRGTVEKALPSFQLACSIGG